MTSIAFAFQSSSKKFALFVSNSPGPHRNKLLQASNKCWTSSTSLGGKQHRSNIYNNCFSSANKFSPTSFRTNITNRTSKAISQQNHYRMMNSSSVEGSAINSGTDVATADLCDDYVESPSRLNVVQPNIFKDYGGRKSFFGPIETVRCLESNPLVKQTVSEPGNGRVLVVDGGGSTRVALLGDMLAQMATENQWSGLIINGCIRDSKIIGQMSNLGVKALGTYPVKSLKDKEGERGVNVFVGGVEFIPGHWVYADEDGIVVSPTPIHNANLDTASKL